MLVFTPSPRAYIPPRSNFACNLQNKLCSACRALRPHILYKRKKKLETVERKREDPPNHGLKKTTGVPSLSFDTKRRAYKRGLIVPFYISRYACSYICASVGADWGHLGAFPRGGNETDGCWDGEHVPEKPSGARLSYYFPHVNQS